MNGINTQMRVMIGALALALACIIINIGDIAHKSSASHRLLPTRVEYVFVLHTGPGKDAGAGMPTFDIGGRDRISVTAKNRSAAKSVIAVEIIATDNPTFPFGRKHWKTFYLPKQVCRVGDSPTDVCVIDHLSFADVPKDLKYGTVFVRTNQSSVVDMVVVLERIKNEQ